MKITVLMFKVLCLMLSVSLGCGGLVFAQQEETAAPQEAKAAEVEPEEVPETRPGYVTLDFKNADIRNVLRVLALKGGVNIVAGPDVEGLISIRLTNVRWDRALEVILNTYDYGYERDEDIITVSSLDKLTEKKKKEVELAEVEDALTEVFTLKYLDATDAKEALTPMLSPRGSISVLKMSGQAGWEFGWGEDTMAKLAREREGGQTRSNVLIVSDIPSQLKKIREMVKEIDIEPAQILIEARVVEVNRDLLEDVGIDWGTGSSGAESGTITSVAMEKNSAGETVQAIGGHSLSDQVTPAVFGPKASGLTSANAGLKFLYQRLRGNQFEIILHALEEDVNTNTLSAPRILTVNNQEATILVGTKWPILKTETEEGVTSTTLDYYEQIGIQLNVVPQVSAAEGLINMIVHPAVTERSTTIGDNQYPVITTREAETRILMNDGETVVIGGLLKDVKKKGVVGVPILKNLPLIGMLFRRETDDVEKIDLLIFLTAKIMKTSGDTMVYTKSQQGFTPELFSHIPKPMAEVKSSEISREAAQDMVSEPIDLFSKEEEELIEELLAQ